MGLESMQGLSIRKNVSQWVSLSNASPRSAADPRCGEADFERICTTRRFALTGERFVCPLVGRSYHYAVSAKLSDGNREDVVVFRCKKPVTAASS